MEIHRLIVCPLVGQVDMKIMLSMLQDKERIIRLIIIKKLLPNY